MTFHFSLLSLDQCFPLKWTVIFQSSKTLDSAAPGPWLAPHLEVVSCSGSGNGLAKNYMKAFSSAPPSVLYICFLGGRKVTGSPARVTQHIMLLLSWLFWWSNSIVSFINKNNVFPLSHYWCNNTLAALLEESEKYLSLQLDLQWRERRDFRFVRKKLHIR